MMMILKYPLLIASLASNACVLASPMLEARQTTNPSLPSGWTPFGCYSDNTSARTLRVASFTSVGNMTIESCLAFCTPAGYNFAGLEFARECYCDNVIESPAVPIDAGNCTAPCTGNANEVCGGSNAISIFQHSSASTSTTASTSTPTTTTASTTTVASTPTPTIKQAVGNFQYAGCFQDRPANQPRILGTQLTVAGGVTAETCTAACKAAGFALAGLEFAQECWCATYMSQVLKLPDSQCNMACNADNTEICGGPNVLSVYQDTTATPLNPNQCLSIAVLFPGAAGAPDFNFNLEMVPTSVPGTPVLLGVVFNKTIPVNQSVFMLSGDLPSTGSGHLFSTTGGSIGLESTENLPAGGFALPPVAGEPVLLDFVSGAASTICVMPDPNSTFGPFIGPPLLGVTGSPNPWASCSPDPLTPIFLPTASNGVCQSVQLKMLPPLTA